MNAEATTTKDSFVESGLRYAEQDNYRRVPIRKICADHGKSHTLIFHYFGTATGFQDAVMNLAVSCKSITVVAQGLADRNPIAMAAPEELRRAAIDALLMPAA